MMEFSRKKAGRDARIEGAESLLTRSPHPTRASRLQGPAGQRASGEQPSPLPGMCLLKAVQTQVGGSSGAESC